LQPWFLIRAEFAKQLQRKVFGFVSHEPNVSIARRLVNIDCAVIGATLSQLAAVIPCVAQHEVVRRRHGIVTNVSALCDPVSAPRHFMPQCARDDITRQMRAGVHSQIASLPGISYQSSA
jgi:hypothetical protein